MSDHSDQNLDYEAGTPSVVDMHDAVRREKILQPSGNEPMGIIGLVLSAIVLLLGGGYLFANSNGFSDSTYKTAYYTPDDRPSLGGEVGEEEQLAWIDKWMKDGKKVYNNCVACHQPGGQGAPGQFPPLVGSEWVDGGTSRLAAILLNGINGPMTVAGQSYNGQMPAWGALSDEKLAQVITYVRRSYGTLAEGDDGVITVEMMKAAREEFKGQKTFWDEAGLKALPADANLPGSKVDMLTGVPIEG